MGDTFVNEAISEAFSIYESNLTKFKNLEFTEFKSMNKPLISKNQE